MLSIVDLSGLAHLISSTESQANWFLEQFYREARNLRDKDTNGIFFDFFNYPILFRIQNG